MNSARSKNLVHATYSGLRLPVLKLADPAFSQDDAEPEAASGLPAGDGVLGRGIAAAQGGVLDGLSTYLMKLGPELLSDAGFSDSDCHIAASLPAHSMRLRLRDMAGMLAGALQPQLQANPGVALQLINIAGGAASDSLNALMQLDAQLLKGRDCQLSLLDCDEAGPAFAAASMAALMQPGQPLEGLSINMKQMRYDWRDASLLEALALAQGDAFCAVSSEGGLFEYGSDGEISANLKALQALPDGSFIAGSIARHDGPAGLLRRSSRIRTRPRKIHEFESLAAACGWRLDASFARPFCHSFLLSKKSAF